MCIYVYIYIYIYIYIYMICLPPEENQMLEAAASDATSPPPSCGPQLTGHGSGGTACLILLV